jgi:aryl carrier-like protein
VTPAEAANHLGLSNYEDLDEAVEMNLFQCRQELIQKADHVLLFPAKEKRFKLLQIAAESLGFLFEQSLSTEEINEGQSTLIEERFQYFQANRSLLLKEIGKATSFHGLMHIQEQLSRNYQRWASFWKDLNTLQPQELKLSAVLDSMRFLQVIHEWKKQGWTETSDLNPTNIPIDIQVEILRLQQVSAKLS